jgi:hypothetical protein
MWHVSRYFGFVERGAPTRARRQNAYAALRGTFTEGNDMNSRIHNERKVTP